MKLLCKQGRLPLPLTKYLKWAERYHNYSLKRRKPKKERVAITRALIGLLEKLTQELCCLEKEIQVEMPAKYYKQREVIAKVLEQQTYRFTTGKSPENRMVRRKRTKSCVYS